MLGAFVRDVLGPRHDRALQRPAAPRHGRGPRRGDRLEVGTGKSVFLTRTLWGAGTTALYLHDGRAASLAEAILEHGGEALAARNAFAADSTTAQQHLGVPQQLRPLQGGVNAMKIINVVKSDRRRRAARARDRLVHEADLAGPASTTTDDNASVTTASLASATTPTSRTPVPAPAALPVANTTGAQVAPAPDDEFPAAAMTPTTLQAVSATQAKLDGLYDGRRRHCACASSTAARRRRARRASRPNRSRSCAISCRR